MARLFPIPFLYRGETYTAVVTITGSYPEDTITVNVPDESLHDLLPGGKVTFSAQNGVQSVEEEINPDPDLFRSILAAVEAHENTKPKVGLW